MPPAWRLAVMNMLSGRELSGEERVCFHGSLLCGESRAQSTESGSDGDVPVGRKVGVSLDCAKHSA